jgi:hypothetical protein
MTRQAINKTMIFIADIDVINLRNSFKFPFEWGAGA